MSEINHVKISLVDQMEAMYNISNDVDIYPNTYIISTDENNYIKPFKIRISYLYVLNNLEDNFKLMGIQGNNKYSPRISNYDELVFTLNSILYGEMSKEERTVLLMSVCQYFNSKALTMYINKNLITSALGAVLITRYFETVVGYAIVSLNCLTPSMVETFMDNYEELNNG